MKNQQLEIGFASIRKHTQPYATMRRRSRAKWWFAQMRQVVDAVTGSRNGSNPPPAQTYLTLPQ